MSAVLRICTSPVHPLCTRLFSELQLTILMQMADD